MFMACTTKGCHLQPCVGVEEEAEVAGMHHLRVHDQACSGSNNVYIYYSGGMNNCNLALNGHRLVLTLFQYLSQSRSSI